MTHSHDEKTAFFNQPSAEANFKYASRMSLWDLDLATALTLSKNPELVRADLLVNLVNVSPFAREYIDRFRLAQRGLGKEFQYSLTPGHYLAWAKRVGIEYPAELEREVTAAGGLIEDWYTLNIELTAKNKALIAELENLKQQLLSKESEKKTLTPKTRNHMLSMINQLVSGLIGERSTKPNKDAEVVIAALKSKNIDAGFTSQTLANYLSEAEKLS